MFKIIQNWSLRSQKLEFHNNNLSYFAKNTILNLRRIIEERENDTQAISNILLANQDHLELLRLKLHYYAERGHFFLPQNLKHLCVDNANDASMLSELAANQCPNLCGIDVRPKLTLRAIDAISRFEKFVAHLIFWIICKIIICFFYVSNFLRFIRIQIMKKRSVLCFVLDASAIFKACVLSTQKISRFYSFTIIRFSGKPKFFEIHFLKENCIIFWKSICKNDGDLSKRNGWHRFWYL